MDRKTVLSYLGNDTWFIFINCTLGEITQLLQGTVSKQSGQRDVFLCLK